MTAGANALTSRATPRPRADTVGTVSAYGVAVVLECLARLGYDVEAVAHAIGLRRDELKNPDALVPCNMYGELIERAQASRFTPNIGLRVGACMPIGSYALLDYLILTAEDVEAGIRQLSRYFALVSNPLRVELEEADDESQ